jgi:hypothetical protein
MHLPVMPTAERYCELIADFQSNCARLGKSKMMLVARLSSADQTRLRCDELQMRLITQPFGFGNGELALVDPTGTGIEPVRDKRWRCLFLVG